MGNKTIYVRDEALWERAKTLAGKDGLSALVAEALQNFITEKEREQMGTKTYRWHVSDGDGEVRVFAFEGKAVRQFPTGSGRTLSFFTVFQTKSGKFVVINAAEAAAHATHFAVYDTVDGLLKDPLLSHHQRKDELLLSMGQDRATWID